MSIGTGIAITGMWTAAAVIAIFTTAGVAVVWPVCVATILIAFLT